MQISGVGTIKKVRFADPIPEGWRPLTLQELLANRETIQPAVLDTWTIASFDGGKIGGDGYNYEIT